MNTGRAILLVAVLSCAVTGLFAEGSCEAARRKRVEIDDSDSCLSCHQAIYPGVVESWRLSKHAWTAFIGNLLPYYQKARSLGLDPLSQETARQLDPDAMARSTVSPLFPDSGVLKRTGLLDRPDFRHNNVNLGCAQCHGSFVVVGKGGKLSGWPNTGIGRVNPDGSLGSCRRPMPMDWPTKATRSMSFRRSITI